MSSFIKLVLLVAVVGYMSVAVNGMWDMFMSPMDLDENGVLQGEGEIRELRESLIRGGESPESAQHAIDSADTNYDGEISAEEYGDMRMNLLF